jgi:hypothetical protein
MEKYNATPAVTTAAATPNPKIILPPSMFIEFFYCGWN